MKSSDAVSLPALIWLFAQDSEPSGRFATSFLRCLHGYTGCTAPGPGRTSLPARFFALALFPLLGAQRLQGERPQA